VWSGRQGTDAVAIGSGGKESYPKSRIGGTGADGFSPEVVHGPDLAEHVSQTLLRGIVRDVADEDLERGSAHLAT